MANAKHLRPSNRVISPLRNSPSLKWTRPFNPPAYRINMVIDRLPKQILKPR